MARLHSDGYLSGSTMGFESFGDLTRSSEDDHFVSENEASWKPIRKPCLPIANGTRQG